MTNHELFENLMQAVERDEGTASILKDKNEQNIKEALLNEITYTPDVFKSTTCTLLTYAMLNQNDKAVSDILQYAKDAKILKEVLASKVIIKLMLDSVTYTPLKFAVVCKSDSAVSDILKCAKENDYLKVILNDAADDLYEAIIYRDEKTIAKWVNHFLSKHHDTTSQIFKTGIFKYILTQKEADKLAEKVNEGKYGEVINTIRKRQALLYGILGIAMIAAGICAFAGATAVVTSLAALSLVIGIIGIPAAGIIAVLIIIEAMSHMLSKIEVSDPKLCSKEKTDGPNEIEVSTEEQPNAEINQINLEKGTDRKEGESIDNGSTAAQHSM